MTNCTREEVFKLLDIQAYKEALGYSMNLNESELFSHLVNDLIVESAVGDKYNITNLGAYAFAKDLSHFEKLSSHAIRVTRYKGINKLTATFDRIATRGVVVGFANLLATVRNHLPLREEIYGEDGRRYEQTDFPQLALREAIANQLVHQDFSVKGSQPSIEIFDNRVEIVNPGAPINKAERLLDLHPISRNEELADLFRKMGLIEARGTGIDKIIISIETENLPAPTIVAKENTTVVTFFERKDLKDMNEKEKINSVYYHAARMYIENSFMTNQSIRERFGLTTKQSSFATRTIALAVSAGMVKPYNENAGKKFMEYVPFWADSHNE